jgi:hypothetical protein
LKSIIDPRDTITVFHCLHIVHTTCLKSDLTNQKQSKKYSRPSSLITPKMDRAVEALYNMDGLKIIDKGVRYAFPLSNEASHVTHLLNLAIPDIIDDQVSAIYASGVDLNCPICQKLDKL